MNTILSIPGNWNHEQKKLLLIILGIILCMMMFYNLKLRPALNDKTRLEKKLTESVQALNELQQYERHQTHFEAEKQRIQEQMQLIDRALPLEWNIAELNQHLFKVVKESQIKLLRQVIPPEKPFEHYAELSIILELTGQYRQLIQFIKKIQELPILINIRKLHIENQVSKTVTPDLKINISLSVYHRYALSQTQSPNAINLQ
ncbi:MAG: type 4a pilus biogenesis protein PilO [SAR324 cluster bacterium]|nr:type 4a pilus biogenesis protein PilO [SAR324 cluster bacterium]